MKPNWNSRCEESLRKEKAEIAKRYKIRFGQTEIYCLKCGKRWPGCTHSLPVKQKYNHPGHTLNDYQEDFGIQFGMSKEEAFEKFREWQQTKKTCQRCEGEKYNDCCPIHLICEEAIKNERNVEGNDHRGRIFEINGLKTVRTELSEARKKVSIR